MILGLRDGKVQAAPISASETEALAEIEAYAKKPEVRLLNAIFPVNWISNPAWWLIAGGVVWALYRGNRK